jgi:hypothetical protein
LMQDAQSVETFDDLRCRHGGSVVALSGTR